MLVRGSQTLTWPQELPQRLNEEAARATAEAARNFRQQSGEASAEDRAFWARGGTCGPFAFRMPPRPHPLALLSCGAGLIRDTLLLPA